MKVEGFIYDTLDTSYLNGASVQVLNSAGKPTGEGTATDPNGYFSIISPTLDAGGKLMLSAVSYTSAVVSPSIFNASGMVGLEPSPDALQAATVTAKIKKSAGYLPYALGAGGLLLLATTGKKKKRASVGAIDIDWKFLAVAGGVALGGYFLVVKPILTKLGILDKPNPTDTATNDAQQASLNQAKQQAASKGSGGQSFPDSQYQNWANTIERIGPNDDETGIVNIVTQCNNLVDWLSLVNAWGIRKEGNTMCAYFDIYCTNYDLPSYLRAVLDAAHINNINLYFAAQGINYQI